MSGSTRRIRIRAVSDSPSNGSPRGFPPRSYALVGRRRDLERVQDLILQSHARLVTVTGPPGVGKTRLAVEVASRVVPEFEDGAVFVDLAPVREAALVLDAVARALDVPDYSDHAPIERLRRYLERRNVLLLLDNFEHVIASSTDVSDLLAACPGVTVLATSRQPLHVRWEHQHALRPLAIPDPGAADPAALLRYPAAALFIERVRAADQGFAVRGTAAGAIAEICRRLDGLPLAIELAAAWVGPLGLEGILSRLTRGKGLPPAGPPEAPERQRTLIDAIAWSYDLLNDTERRVFRALGAFAGETELEAIEAVCPGLRVDVLTPVAHLVDKHLLVRIGDGQPQFRMLETIREFAEERLELIGEAEDVRRRHARWYLEVARQAERFIWSEHQAVWFERIERAHDNVRGALRWCLDGGDEETGVLLAAAMHRFWFARGHIREGRRWGELAASRCGVSDRARALALRNLAFFLVQHGETEEAVGLAEQATTLARSAGDAATLAWVLHGMALAATAVGDVERAEHVNRELLDVARRSGDEALAIRALCGIGAALQQREDTGAARALFEEALALARPRRDQWLIAVATRNLGHALKHDDRDQALRLLEESLALAHDIGHRRLTVQGLEGVAGLVAPSDRAEMAAALLGASESLRDAFEFARTKPERAAFEAAEAAARERLGDAPYEAALGRGREMTADQAVALALGRPVLKREKRSPHPGGLTGREVQVVQHVARGLTNRQIAETLDISERTVDAHLQNVRNKLGMEKRAQIAAWASAHLSGTEPVPTPDGAG